MEETALFDCKLTLLILEKISDTPPAMTRTTLCGVIFALGFITQNISLLPGFQAENQPVLLVALSLAALSGIGSIARGMRLHHVQIIVLAMLACGLTGFQYLTTSDLIRAFLGPVIGAGATIYLAYLKPRHIEKVLYVHALVPAIGIVAPGLLADVLSALGLRGASYYGGYSGYFYSEPSYAATNIMFLYGLRLLLGGEAKSKLDLITILLLLLTKSATGFIFAGILAWRFLTLKSFIIAAVSLVAASPFLVVPDRVGILLDALRVGFSTSDMYVVGLLDPSAFFRYLANAVSVAGVIISPLGLGTFEYTRLVDLLPEYGFDGLHAALQSSDVYLTLNYERNNVAQAVPFAFATLGGVIFLVYFAAIYIKFIWAVANFPARVALVALATSLFWWQSQLGSAAFWILLGAIQYRGNWRRTLRPTASPELAHT